MTTTEFVQVWPIILSFDFSRYALAAGLMWLLLLALRRRLAGRRIHGAEPPLGQVRSELAASLRTVLIFSLVGFAVYSGKRAGVLMAYDDISDYGWLYFAGSLVLAIVAHDAYFYWTHRAMHHPRVFRFFHRQHHRSVQPTPWAAYSFDAPEALVQAAFLPIFLFIVPIHDLAIFLFLMHMIVRNVMGHCGYEILPRGLADSHWWGWCNSVTHHDLHHETFRWNYGLYFTWWDRMMGTEHPEYRTRLRGAGQAVLGAAFLIVAGAPLGACAAESIQGEWATQGFSAKVRIEKCGSALCGRITWLWAPNDAQGKPLIDASNPA